MLEMLLLPITKAVAAARTATNARVVWFIIFYFLNITELYLYWLEIYVQSIMIRSTYMLLQTYNCTFIVTTIILQTDVLRDIADWQSDKYVLVNAL